MSLIVLKNLTKTYQSGPLRVEALKNITITAEAGAYIALTGASGSGKSTLMNVLGCLDTPTSGSYHLDGKDVSRYTDDELALIRNKMIGFVFQTFNLIPRMNALENVAMPLIYRGIDRKERLTRAEKMLESVGLESRMLHKPEELSGGQKQRVAIARALINEPSLILADEPTGNLDSQTSLEIMELFEDLHVNGHTIILVTHEQDIAERTRRTIELKDGQIIQDAFSGQ